jgi:predicted RNase H-like HicB family nuclease
MQLPIVIHKDSGSVYGVTVPDIVGCYSWGNTIDEAIANAKEAIVGHLETKLELGDKVKIVPSTIEELKNKTEYAGATWGLVDIDLSVLDSKPERVNVSLPRFVLHRIDEYVKRQHETRSGFLARAAINELAHEK